MGTTIESDWENTRLLEELEAARAEIENVQLVSQLHYDANLSLRQQLAAEQAKNVRLREALQFLIATKELKESVGKTPEYEQMRIIAWVKATVALSSPSDTSALEAIVKKAGEVMRELAENACKAYDEKIETMRDNEYQAELAGRQAGAARCASAIRSLPAVTLDDLKEKSDAQIT